MLNDEELVRGIERTLWAKSEPFKPLWMHLLETGIIAQELISSGCFYPVGKELSENFNLPREEIINLVGYIGSVHDLGKCYAYFQMQATDSEIAKILKENNVPIFEADKFRHELYGCKILKRIWKETGVFSSDKKFRNRVAEVVGYHHQGKTRKRYIRWS
ncbi:CRISPR-associated endonuclease Cas3'' [Selenomonas sp. KH1T6]|uniref:CRISPR-associated endonuclease Cas3'' n=1 Tax=Selenomonas sp. KH1T6 TaxID=3158784 RepID=UPI001587B633